mmetsp:Transcript_9855/g.18553  ORF Transcript_9855/g.18553 Transcript_9855/m.18553 type:complete len:187 (-) Transcript_9855:5788-6348(-)
MADGRGTYPSHSGYGGYNQGGSAYQQSYQTSSYGGYPQHQNVNQGGYYGGTPTLSQQQQHQALRDQQRGRDPRQQQQQLTRLQQYLGQVLSQGGSNALPYAEQVKYVVRQHVLDSVSEFPSLACSVTRFTHNDGSDVSTPPVPSPPLPLLQEQRGGKIIDKKLQIFLLLSSPFFFFFPPPTCRSTY